MSQILSRFSFSAIKKQVLDILPALGIGIVLALGGVSFTVFVARQTDNPIWRLAKDPADIVGFPPYIGLLSNWGVILWTMAAAVCLFGAAILKQQKAPTDTLIFITFSGILNLVLAVDDLFLLHDRLFPSMFHLPENFFYLLYALTFLLYLLLFAVRIIRYDYLLFGAGLVLLVGSRILVRIPFLGQFMTTGDMLKYVGIVFWLAFFYRTVFHEISALINHGNNS